MPRLRISVSGRRAVVALISRTVMIAPLLLNSQKSTKKVRLGHTHAFRRSWLPQSISFDAFTMISVLHSLISPREIASSIPCFRKEGSRPNMMLTEAEECMQRTHDGPPMRKESCVSGCPKFLHMIINEWINRECFLRGSSKIFIHCRGPDVVF
jgi:hypothetical protein